MGKRGLGGLGGVVALGAALWHGHGLGGTPAPVAGVPAAAVASTSPVAEVRGAGSCSATACHGGSRPSLGKVLRNEHSIWLMRDGHADAYRTLTGKRSQSIEAKLSGGKIAAEKDARCLACHATPVPPPAAEGTAVLLSDGVSCEACHGAAGRWIGEHTRGDWPGQGPETEKAVGLVNTVDLARRAQLCATCHVGEAAHDGLPARDVNHDLIAAGHPRLNFEFSAYFANLPHHWRGDVGRDGAADFQARAWAVGQVATARAAVDLLRARTRHPETWPEFTEFGCFSCHHDLRDDPWRRSAPAVSSPPGRARWGSWHYPLLSTLADAYPAPDKGGLTADLEALRKLMEEPRPDADKVARQADAVSGRLGAWLAGMSGGTFNAAAVEKLYARVAALKDSKAIGSWDEATQRYLAMVPLAQALQMLGAGTGPDRARELTELQKALSYPAGFDSPKSFDPTAAP